MTTSIRRAHPIVAAACGVTLAGTTLVALGEATAIRDRWPAEADTLYLPASSALRFASLGHSEAAADLVAARANVYYGAQIVARGEQKWLSRYLDTVVDLDPRFQSIYMRGASMLVYASRRITVDNLLAANRLLDRGASEFPDDWQFPFQRGFNYMFELPQTAREDPRVPDWRQRGVESLRHASLFNEAPAWLPNLTAKMLTEQGNAELAIKHLEQNYAVTSNEEAREQIRAKLAALRGAHASERLERAAREFGEMLSQRYPYAPEAFSVVAGPRFEPGFVRAELAGAAPSPAAILP